MSEINNVKRALSRGYRTTKAIAEASGLSYTKTQTYITRLMHRNQAESTKSPDPVERAKHIKHYHMVGVGFLLQNIWRVK